MRTVLITGSAIVGSYLIGSIPFGLLIARARGIDIRRVGSGNIGATNVFRCVGKPWGILAFVCDFLKGLLSAMLMPLAAASLTGTPAPRGLVLACGFIAVAGHNWPIWLRFKGGKGIATSTGALLGIAPAAVGIGLAVWILAFMISRYVSLASILAALSIGAAAWPLYRDQGMLTPAALTLLALAAVWRHKPNIQRLLNGTENRFGRRKRPEGDTP